MKAKEFKELISKIPDDRDMVFELRTEDNMFVYAEDATLDTDYTVCLPEKRIMLSELMAELQKDKSFNKN